MVDMLADRILLFYWAIFFTAIIFMKFLVNGNFQHYFSNRVLQINEGMEYGLGMIQPELAAALLGGWIIVYLIVWRGLHQSGYIIWFTALFPYVVMITLLIKALTLEGASDGLMAYINVSFHIM